MAGLTDEQKIEEVVHALGGCVHLSYRRNPVEEWHDLCKGIHVYPIRAIPVETNIVLPGGDGPFGWCDECHAILLEKSANRTGRAYQAYRVAQYWATLLHELRSYCLS